MPNLFQNAKIPIQCPECGRQTPKTLRWLEKNDRLACACGRTIVLDAQGLLAARAKAEKLVDDLKRRIKSRFKR